jgi:uncharacterized protein YlxW (UPF0749 family)
MTLPKFVNIEQRNDWFPEHDSLLVDGVLSEDNNAFLFWQFNCKVRKALQEIRERIEDGEELKVTRTLVVQIAKVQYVGLYNIRRRGWVMLEIRMLIKVKERVHKKKVIEAYTHESEVNELKSLIRDLHQDKANLGTEKSILNQELDKYKRLVKTQDKQLSRLKTLIEDKLSN